MPVGIKFALAWDYKGQRGSEVLFHTALGRLKEEGAGNLAPAFALIAEEILAPFVEKQFESQGAAGATHWAELAESTLKARERRGIKGDIILYETGKLVHSFVEKTPEHIEEISRRKLRWGSKLPYALFHQTGTGKGFQKQQIATGPGTGRGMPMRKILVFTPEMKQRMRNTLVGRLAHIARQVGFAVTPSSERSELDPLTARRIGQQVLGG